MKYRVKGQPVWFEGERDAKDPRQFKVSPEEKDALLAQYEEDAAGEQRPGVAYFEGATSALVTFDCGEEVEEAEVYTPRTMEPYRRPECYIGPDWYGWYAAFGRSRDSDVLEESNFHVALKALGGESGTVVVVRDFHWAVGWVEAIRIHASDAEALREADELREKREDYCILDEDDFSEREWESANEVWAGCFNVKERLEMIQEHNKVWPESPISIFAARHPWIPQGDDGRIFERCTSN